MTKTRGGLLAPAWTEGDKGDRPVFALWGSTRYAFDSAAAKGLRAPYAKACQGSMEGLSASQTRAGVRLRLAFNKTGDARA